MVKAVYYYFHVDTLKDIPNIMKEKFEIIPELQLSISPMAENNFDLSHGFPAGLTDYTYIKKYINNSKIDYDLKNQVMEIFPMYIDQISRFDWCYECTYHDYLNHFNILFDYFYSFLLQKKVDIVYFSNFPHMGIDLLLYYIAHNMGIKTFLIFQEIEKETNIPVLGYTDKIDFNNLYHSMKKDLRNSKLIIPYSYKKDLSYMKNLKFPVISDYKYDLKFKNLLKLITKPRKFVRKGRFHLMVKNNFKNLKVIESLSNKEFREQKHDYNCKYVYFGLHLQPEATTSFYGAGTYSDQLLAIEQICQFIPDDWKVFVKENPKQIEFQRHRLFYDRLTLNDKVVFVNHKTDTYELIEHSQFVASINGTMIYEAVSGGKPALMFGSYWYNRLPGVFKYNKNLKLEEIMNCKINHNLVQEKTREFYNKCIDGITEPCFFETEYYNKNKNDETITNLLYQALTCSKLNGVPNFKS